MGYSAKAKFDNFKVNSGRIATVNETVDSVRLLPLNDNFDDGVLNEDRWGNYGSSNPILEASGSVHLISNTATPASGVALRKRLEGDFIAVSKYKNYTNSPTEAIQGRYIMNAADGTSGFYINRLSDRLSRAGGQFLVGLSYNGGNWGMGADYPYTSDSGVFRLVRQGTSGFTDYWDGTKWVTIHSGSGLTTMPALITLYNLSQ